MSRPRPLFLFYAAATWMLGVSLTMTDHRARADTAQAAWPVSYHQDANLFDVCFVNAQRGWAVGDRGTILHTRDGGETWQLQTCPIDGRLEAVQFLDEEHGWAVGGQTTPFTHRSLGFVLRTDNGGQTWRRDPGQFLPWLTGVHFSDAKHGVAYGLPSAMFPSAVYHTSDGGQHWTPWPGASTGWIDAVVDARGQGCLIDRSGQFVELLPGELVPRGKLKQETRLPLRLSDNGQGQLLLCGNQGLVQVSGDHGRSWSIPRGLPSAGLLSEFDWQGVENLGPYAWIVGVPGSRVLTTRDGGQNWQLTETGQQLPLYAIEFVDTQHGWTVGALGTILVTHDGGQSWIVQQGARHHIAVLGVFGRAEKIPWEMVAQLAAGEGYWTRLEVLSDSVALPTKAGQTPVSTRLHEATVMLGGVGANLIQALPAPDPRLQWPATSLSQQWDRVTRSDTALQLTEYLVRQIRTWQPDLIMVSEPADDHDGLSQLTRQIVLQATEQAADPTQYTMHLQAGLAAWRVARVSTLAVDEDEHGYPVSAHQLVASLGQTVSQLADRARANLFPVHRSGPERLRLRTLDGDGTGQHGLLISRTDSGGGVSRRLTETVATDLRDRNQQAQRQRNLEALLRETTQDDAAVWQQAMHLASELSPLQRSELYLACASQSLRDGNAATAFELFHQLQRDVVDTPLREAACVQLFWYLASEEASMHWQLPRSATFQQVAEAGMLQAEPGAVRPVTFVSPMSAPPAPIAAAGGTGDSQPDLQSRWQLANALIEQIQAQQPDLYFEPLLRFPLAALHHRTGQSESAVKFWRSQLSGRTDPSYRSWAASELALLEPDRLPARPTWHCPRLSRPPHLDGKLDEAAWQEIPPTQLHSAVLGGSSPPATQVRLAYDAEFLYLAVEATKIPSLTYRGRDATRQRDQVLDGDRIELYLDVDRDAVTHWCLSIDYRGGASERLNDDVTWDPDWFVAVDDDQASWTIEAAVPLTALTRQAVVPSVVWCLGVQRIMPGHDWETWLQPAPVEARPEEFGLLQFQP